MIKNIWQIKIIIISLFLIYCTPQQRLNRLVNKHPHLKTNVLDTLILNDTIFLPNVIHDTTTIVEYHDSVVIVNNEKVFAKYIFDTITNEIHHYIECKSDTVRIIREIPIETEKIVIQKKDNQFKNYILIGALILGLIVVLYVLKLIKDIFR